MEYIASHPKCTIEEIARDLDDQYMCIYRILEGRENSRSSTGLVNAGAVKVSPGINSKGNLCWKYQVNIPPINKDELFGF